LRARKVSTCPRGSTCLPSPQTASTPEDPTPGSLVKPTPPWFGFPSHGYDSDGWTVVTATTTCLETHAPRAYPNLPPLDLPTSPGRFPTARGPRTTAFAGQGQRYEAPRDWGSPSHDVGTSTTPRSPTTLRGSSPPSPLVKPRDGRAACHVRHEHGMT
jgi:hypothetical protein